MDPYTWSPVSTNGLWASVESLTGLGGRKAPQLESKESMLAKLNALNFLSSPMLPVSQKEPSVEGFMVTTTDVLNAVNAGIEPSSIPARFSTGRITGIPPSHTASTDATGKLTNIVSQVQALQSFYDLFLAYTAAGSSQNIFATIKTTLDNAVGTFKPYYDTFSSFTGTALPSVTYSVPAGGFKTNLGTDSISDLVISWNSNRDSNTDLLAAIRTVARTENMPKELYISTYSEARKYINDSDITILPSLQITTARDFLNSTNGPLNSYAGPDASPTPLPLSGAAGAATLILRRNEMNNAIVTIVNALVTKYNSENPASETSLDASSSIANIRIKRNEILNKWDTLLKARRSDINSLIGAAGSTGTYQTLRLSGCVLPYPNTGDCFDDVYIATQKNTLNDTLLYTVFDSPTSFSSSSNSSCMFNNYTFSRSGAVSENLKGLFDTQLSEKTTANSISVTTGQVITITLPIAHTIQRVKFSATVTGSGTCSFKVNTLATVYNITSANPNTVNNTIDITGTSSTTSYTIKFTVPATTLRINNFLIYSTEAVPRYSLTDYDPVYKTVNGIYKIFNDAKNALSVAAQGEAYTALKNFRSAYTNLNIYLPATYSNKAEVDQANTDSRPSAASLETETSKDGATLKTGTDIANIKSKYEDALRFLYNGVLAKMDALIDEYNGLGSRYTSFIGDAEIKLLDPEVTTRTLTAAEYTTITNSPKNYRLAVIDLPTVPIPAQIGTLTTTAGNYIPVGGATSYQDKINTLRGAIQPKLFTFLSNFYTIVIELGDGSANSVSSVKDEFDTTKPGYVLPTSARMVAVMNLFAGSADVGAPVGQDVGLTGQQQTACQNAMTAFYTNTYLPYVQYLSGADVTGDITTAVIKCTYYYLNADGTTKMFASLTEGDTYASLKTTVDNALVTFVQKLVTGYFTVGSTWGSYGMGTTANIDDIANQPVVNLANAATIRDRYGGSGYWPQLITDMQNLVTARLVGATNFYRMFTDSTGTDVTIGVKTVKGMGQTTTPFVTTGLVSKSGSSVMVEGNLISDGGPSIIIAERGFENQAGGRQTVSGSGTGSFMNTYSTAPLPTSVKAYVKVGQTYYYGNTITL